MGREWRETGRKIERFRLLHGIIYIHPIHIISVSVFLSLKPIYSFFLFPFHFHFKFYYYLLFEGSPGVFVRKP